MQLKKHFITTVTILTSFAVILTSCIASGKQKAVKNLSDAFRSDYISDLTFSVNTSNGEYNGTATVTRNEYITGIDIHSPDPYSGLSIEYNVKGLPESIAMHFSGMNATLPPDSIARINPITSLFADDFADTLSKLPKESIKEYELEDGKGCCASLVYNGADISVYFSSDGSVPRSLEYSSDAMTAAITFDTFKPEITDLT